MQSTKCDILAKTYHSLTVLCFDLTGRVVAAASWPEEALDTIRLGLGPAAEQGSFGRLSDQACILEA